MTKELFVSSTPHETKVGLVEDDLLAEIYLERENEYTLAGSIYKGRVTRVLPGMQSAFVDIGLERDAFLYVSDFMELEEHDDDLTDVVPATRNVPDLRQQSPKIETADSSQDGGVAEAELLPVTDEGTFEAETIGEGQAAPVAESTEVATAGEPQSRDRGGFRGRRRRRGGRRDGRSDGRDRTSDRGQERSPERGPEPRYSRPAESVPSRSADSARNQPSGPPPGYQPILLPGESISKYQRWSQPAPASQPAVRESIREAAPEQSNSSAPLAATFPEDEPIFAATESLAEPLHEEHEDIRAIHEETIEHEESASTSASWNQEFRAPEAAIPALGWPGELRVV